MAYAIDLSPRQCSRTLEQAARHQAIIVLEPRQWAEGESLTGRLQAIRAEAPPIAGQMLAVMIEPAENPAETQAAAQSGDRLKFAELLSQLPGTYCDAIVQLGDNRYLFSTDVVNAEIPSDKNQPIFMHITKPETMQVAQRRRFWRFRPGQSAQVELHWGEGGAGPRGAIGWMCNVSGDGLACRIDSRIGDQLWIGDQLSAEFSLAPGDPQRYVLDAVLCNKTPAGTPDQLILGLQFVTGPGHESTVRTAERLRQQLLVKFAAPADTREGADA